MANQGLRSSYIVNGAIQDDSQDGEARALRLIALQLEALGSSRRHAITTQGFKEDLKLETRSLTAIERARRINQRGTAESQITDDVKDGLAGWKTAWVQLENDGTAETSLANINDGQTHREKLMTDPSVREYNEDLDDIPGLVRNRTGGSGRGRGGGRGARGGGQAGGRPPRHHGPSRIPAGMGSLLTSPTSGKGLKGSTQSLQVPKENATTKASRKASSSRPGAEDFEALAGNITNSLPKTNPPRAKEARPPAVQNPTRHLSTEKGSFLAPPADFMAAAKNMFKLPSTKKMDANPPASVQLPASITSTQSTSDSASAEQQQARLAVSRKRDDFFASAKRINEESSAKERKAAFPASAGINAPTVSMKSAAPESASSRSETVSTDKSVLTVKPVTSHGEPPNSQMPGEVTLVAKGNQSESVPAAKDRHASAQKSELSPAIAQLLSDHRGIMPPTLFTQLQEYLANQAQSTTEKHIYPASTQTSPKAIVKIPKPISTKASPIKASAPLAESGLQDPVISRKENPSQVLTNAPVPIEAPVKPVAVASVSAQPSISVPSTTSGIASVLRSKPNIFGEHVIKDRYTALASSNVSHAKSSESPISPLSAGFSKLTLREPDNPIKTASSSSQGQSANVETKASGSSPILPIKLEQKGPVQARLAASATPHVVDSAIARQYAHAPKSVSPTSPPKYATVNPFALSISKEHSPLPTRAQENSVKQSLSQNPLGEDSQMPSEPKSTEIITSASRGDPSSVNKRFPTTPYNWNERGAASKLQLPAFLQDLEPNRDMAAAARAQHGRVNTENNPLRQGAVGYKVSELHQPASAVAAPHRSNSKLQLPSFLQGLEPNKDTAAAARAQYSGIASNSELQSASTAGKGLETRRAAITNSQAQSVAPSGQSIIGSHVVRGKSPAKENKPPLKGQESVFNASKDALLKWQRARTRGD